MTNKLCVLLTYLILNNVFNISYGSNAINQNINNNKNYIEITSDNLHINYKQGYLVYKNNVKLNQENKHLLSDNIYIHFKNNSKNNNKITEIIAVNNFNRNNNQKPVEYIEQDIKNNQTKYSKYTKATANKIKFDPNINKITLEGNAIIEQDNKILTSELLFYDIKKELAYMPKTNNTRTKIIVS